MSNLRNGKAIKPEVFEQSQNTLITIGKDRNGFYSNFYSKLQDKIDALRIVVDLKNIQNEDTLVLFVWVGIKSSHTFELNYDDIYKLIDNYND